MNERFERTHQLPTELGNEIEAGTAGDDNRGFSAAELPLIIQGIVDDLQPLLTPYQAAFYWYLFRHSIAQSGSPLLRVSTRRLQIAVVKSSRSDTVSLRHVRETLAALEGIGAIRRENEPNRDGTLYRVLIPDEIEPCRRLRTERVATQSMPTVTEADLDYYNVRQNRTKVYERDSYKCHYCGKQLTRFTATLDHIVPVAEYGDNSLGNLVTACVGCNSRKNGRPVGDFLADSGAML